MKPIFQFFTLFLLCVLSNSAVSAQPGSARHQLDTFAEGLDSLQARFRQVVISTDGRMQDSSEGKVWLSRPDLFRWEYGGDFPELVVADGTRVWIYDEMLEQVTVKDQAAAATDSPLALLTDTEDLDDTFEVREAGDLDGIALLELRARSMETEFERFLLGLRGDRLELIIMEDAFGLRTELRFSNLVRNAEVDPGLFEFTPPAGADVIGALPGAAQSR